MIPNFSIRMTPEVKAVIEAMEKVTTQDELNVIANAWQARMNNIASAKKMVLKKGQTIEWTHKGLTRIATVLKVNRKTVEVVDAGANPFGRTVTRVPMSMVDKVVEEAA